ncbi:LytR/AlgR family response regulator transcription factor [Formosa maritima]|uniref:LytR/AlgR family response regulator transcription factor n=1 Tax=Formosa maritima TaxID=2592046 RepID=UPI001F32F4FA|nr:LytTR family DNA-binding domain-containing protein [Formosa maritima]
MKISTLIIDDEPLARLMIERLLLPRTEFEIIGQCGTGKDAVNMINQFKPDLIFLDIKLKDMTGFDVLEAISINSPIVIFATAFDTYSLKAYDYFAFDYLLKPFNEDRFYKSLNKVIETFKSKDTDFLQHKIQSLLDYIQPKEQKNNLLKKTIPVPLKNKTTFIESDKIIYITASNSYIEIFTNDKKYLLRNSMSNIMIELLDSNFCRIHRSTIINIEYIKELIHSNFGEIDVRMKDMKQFRISRSYKKEFLTKIGVRK